MVQMNRRKFIGQAAMTTAAAGFAMNGFRPLAAGAQYATLLSYFLSANPFLGVVDLFEMGLHMSDPKIIDVIDRIEKLARDQKNNFDELQRQIHSIVRQELNLNDMKRDIQKLSDVSYHLKIATGLGNQAEIVNLRGDIDEIAHQLGFYGVAGCLAYLNAIALQNSVHSMLGSPANVIIAVNEPHEERIGQIIYDGKHDDTLEHAIQVKQTEMSSDPYYKNFQVLKDRVGSWYSLGVVTRYYEAGGAISTCDLRYTYEGFQGGQPVIASRSCGPETFGSNTNNSYNGRLVKATYTPTGTSEAYPVFVRSNNSLVFPQDWQSGQALVYRVNGIADEYRRLYNPNYGPEISSRMSLSIPMTQEHAAFRTYLINTGLGSVKRILDVANKKLA